jgi:hypothetical protein
VKLHSRSHQAYKTRTKKRGEREPGTSQQTTKKKNERGEREPGTSQQTTKHI